MDFVLKLCMPFVGLATVRLLRPNMAVLYHVNGKLQRANSDQHQYPPHNIYSLSRDKVMRIDKMD